MQGNILIVLTGCAVSRIKPGRMKLIISLGPPLEAISTAGEISAMNKYPLPCAGPLKGRYGSRKKIQKTI
jgi:hypothetical protein